MHHAVAVGPRTYLRKPTREDAEEFVRRAVAARMHLQPFVFAPEDDGAYAQWLQRGTRPEVEQFLVCTRDDDHIAGFVNLNNIVRNAMQLASVGWASFPPFSGNGHLTDGVRLALEVAFTQLRLHRIEANIQPDNERSRALARRCGFSLEGYSPKLMQVGGSWRDHERWAIRDESWRSRRRHGWLAPRPPEHGQWSTGR